MQCSGCGHELPQDAAFCPACGTAVPASTPSTPSTASTPSSSDATVAPPPSSDAPPATDVPASPPSGPPPPPPGFDAGGTPVALQPAPAARPKTHAARIVIAVVGVAAVVAVVALAARGWGGNSTGGSSPQDATDKLQNAVRRADPIGAAALIAPGELSSVTRSMKAASKKAKTLGYVKSSTNPFEFLNLTVDRLETRVDDVAPGFAKVSFEGGTFGYKLDPSRIPASWNVDTSNMTRTENAVSIANARCAQLDDASTVPYCKEGNDAPFVIMVKQDGRWYYSVAYTALEYWRLSEGLPAADLGSALRRTDSGAASPEAAVTDALRAFGNIGNQADLDRVLALAPPDELGALYDYRAAIYQALQQGEVDLPGRLYDVVGTPTFDTEAGDHDVRVYPRRVELRYTSTDDYGATKNGTLVIDRRCVEDSTEDPPRQCITEQQTAKDLGVGDIFVSTVKQHGRWYVSPMATLGDYLDIIVGRLDRNTLNKLRENDGVSFADVATRS